MATTQWGANGINYTIVSDASGNKYVLVDNGIDTIAILLSDILKKAAADVSGADWVLNENDMASNSATKVPTQSSVKTFANTKLAKTQDTIQALKEKVNVVAGAANDTANIDTDTGLFWYFTSVATANWTRNIRASASVSLNTRMATGESLTLSIITTQGATPYMPTAWTIDGNAITPKWVGGTAPTAGNASGLDVYNISIIKTGENTFTMINALIQVK